MNIKRFLLITTSFFIATSGISLKLNKNSSENIAKKTLEYTKNFESDNFIIAAHRGFSSLEVENTENAIALAATKEYIDYIEIDARMTRDRKIVLSHNDQILTSTFSKKNISELNYQNIRNETLSYQLPLLNKDFFNQMNSSERKLFIKRQQILNNKSYKIAGLLEGISACQNKKILLDLKFNQDVETFTEELQNELKTIDTSNIIFQSSDLSGILYLEKHTNYNCLAILDKKDDLKRTTSFKNIGIRKNLVKHNIIKEQLEEGKNVAIWTIDTVEELDNITAELNELYEDVIYITNYPDVVATKLHETKKLKKTLTQQ